ncbi:hypothetical protein BSLG_007580 [Batrachochytrium salamandrivorans]|nr:hypothetical protein BSLG_007580 [Batrachochytrium salamandrivorans]
MLRLLLDFALDSITIPPTLDNTTQCFAVKMSEVESWATPESSGQFTDAISGLVRLHIVTIKNEGSRKNITVNAVFQENIHNALVGGYAKDCWESVLHYLVGTPSDKRPKAIVKLLEKSGLMAPMPGNFSSNNDELRITSKGFQFLLQDVNVQIWAFLLQYLEMAEQLNMELVEVLNFFFQLGSLELGQKKSTRFYPTRLATSLTSGTSTGAVLSNRTADADSDGFIIIETNYRVYSYTDSPLQIAVLSLFISMRVRFANMVIGIITRDSVREALAKGISAEQIITYLTTHAHPEMKKGSPILPSTIVDQIRLWEMERNRLRISRGHLYQMFSGDQEYREILKYATDFGYELWHSDAKRLVIVSAQGHEHIKVFFAKQRNRDSSTLK